MFVRAIVLDHADNAELVALLDSNPGRLAAHNRWLGELGHPPVACYPASDFAVAIEREQVDAVVVCTVDATHDEYIVAALAADRDVITEKPMTTDAAKAARILAAERTSAGTVTVTFNYRYNPVHEEVKRRLAAGEIGAIGSVHFEWLLDVRHGADYFRRWHREKVNSGGLLVHKSGHHFDLVNWWLAATPELVFAQGRLFFYGDAAAATHGHAEAPFALDLAAHPRLRELYLEPAAHDGYRRDLSVFAPGVSIEDDLAVLVRYDSGATMTYHLTAYAPWEGYRLMVNGSRGRLELEVVESDHVSPTGSRHVKGAALHGVEAAPEEGYGRLTLHPYWTKPTEVPLPPRPRTGHGGADARMAATLFGSTGFDSTVDPLDRSATAVDGARALLIGVAANASMESGLPVRPADLLNVKEPV
jgi:predicted dehydrogenase